MARKEKEMLDLECKLTDPEILAYSREMSENVSRQRDAEYRKSKFNKQIAADIEEIESKISSLSEKVRSGTEYRQVECVIVYNWDTGKRAWYRKDNGDLVKENGIPSEDMQEYLKLEAEKEPDNNKQENLIAEALA